MFPSRSREDIVLDIFGSGNLGPLLDIGCGNGDLATKIGEASGTEELYGVDVSAEAIRQSKQRGVTAFQVDLDEEDLPFEDDQFGSIHSGEVVDYLTDPDHMFREVRRCLRPGGLFVVTTPNLASAHNRLALLAGQLPFPMRASCDRLVGEREDASPLSERCSLYTYSMLRSVLSAHGFEVVEARGAYSTPPESSLLHRLLEGIIVEFPSLSYRNIFVCRNPT